MHLTTEIQEFNDAYYRSYSMSGTLVWDVQEQGTPGGPWLVNSISSQDGSVIDTIAICSTEEAARWIALSHNSAEQMVEAINEALDHAERMEEQRDDAQYDLLEYERNKLEGGR